MEQRDEAGRTDYPRGRGYGHDYMRGGEVFGGYGYSEREGYQRTRGSEPADAGTALEDELPAAPPDDGDIAPRTTAPADEAYGSRESRSGSRVDGSEEGAPAEAADLTLLPRVFGGTGQLRRSRSFYATQAQLQARIYGPHRFGRGPYHDRVREMDRSDDELRSAVQEALFYDTWVDAQRIAVEVAAGVVTLRGALPSHEEIGYATDDVWDIPGVRGVNSELVVAADAESREAANTT